MPDDLARLRHLAAVQAVLNEFRLLGRTAFLRLYGFGRSRDYLVRDPVIRRGQGARERRLDGVHREIGASN